MAYSIRIIRCIVSTFDDRISVSIGSVFLRMKAALDIPRGIRWISVEPTQFASYSAGAYKDNPVWRSL